MFTHYDSKVKSQGTLCPHNNPKNYINRNTWDSERMSSIKHLQIAPRVTRSLKLQRCRLVHEIHLLPIMEAPRVAWLGTTTDTGTSQFLGIPDYTYMHTPEHTQEECSAAVPSFTQPKKYLKNITLETVPNVLRKTHCALPI